jgi:hypothetical protein
MGGAPFYIDYEGMSAGAARSDARSLTGAAEGFSLEGLEEVTSSPEQRRDLGHRAALDTSGSPTVPASRPDGELLCAKPQASAERPCSSR